MLFRVLLLEIVSLPFNQKKKKKKKKKKEKYEKN